VLEYDFRDRNVLIIKLLGQLTFSLKPNAILNRNSRGRINSPR
jgi:hypothetical protein